MTRKIIKSPISHSLKKDLRPFSYKKSHKKHNSQLKQNMIKYTKQKEEILFNHLRKILIYEVVKPIAFITNPEKIKKYLNTGDRSAEFQKDIEYLLECILKCTKEMLDLYFEKRDFNVNENELKCIGISALKLACKIILGYDWYREGCIEIEPFCKKNINKYEAEFLIENDWNGCKKTMDKIYDRYNIGEF